MTSEVEALYIHVCIPKQKFQNMADLHEYVSDHYFIIQIPGFSYMIKRF